MVADSFESVINMSFNFFDLIVTDMHLPHLDSLQANKISASLKVACALFISNSTSALNSSFPKLVTKIINSITPLTKYIQLDGP